MGKSQVTLILTVILSSAVSFGQTSAAPSASAAAEVAAENAAANTAPTASSEVVVVQQQVPAIVQQQAAPVVAQPQVIEQPTTIVTASPLTVSRADELRKARERMEIETEQKIVEKLETSRLEDEQKRMNSLFGDKLGKQSEVQAAPAPVAAPLAPAAPAKSEEELKSEIAAQVRADMDAAKLAEEAKSEKPRWSVGGVLSTLSYPDASNVGSDFGAGVAVNWIGTDRFGIEMSAVFSQSTLDVDYSFFKEIDQQNWMLAGKYYFMKREFTPVAGALVSYTHREYTDMYSPNGYGVLAGVNSATTDAMDAGLLVGVQFTPSKNLSLGLDYRWLTNIETRYSEPRAFNRSSYQASGLGYNPLEEVDYEFVSFSMNFLY